jgi:hypothetical protein
MGVPTLRQHLIDHRDCCRAPAVGFELEEGVDKNVDRSARSVETQGLPCETEKTFVIAAVLRFVRRASALVLVFVILIVFLILNWRRLW